MKIKNAIFGIILLGALSACVTPMDYLMVESAPEEVLLKFPDGHECTTPCSITVTEDVTVTAAKAGYGAQEFELGQGQTGRVIVSLELVASTMEVEEGALPDL